jgi:hypothetical protein
VDLDDGKVEPFCDSPAEERAPCFSPDGRWMAFTSTQSASKREIHLRSFPDGMQTRQISFGGGDWPRWAPNAKPGEPMTLYYRTPVGIHMIQIDPADGSTVDRPKLVYGKPFGQSDTNLIDYDVAADGRMLIVERSERAPKATEIQIILNWYQLLPPRG